MKRLVYPIIGFVMVFVWIGISYSSVMYHFLKPKMLAIIDFLIEDLK